MPHRNINIKKIDALLPQTQCGDCEYDGCLPYAKAITQGDALDKCLPGGVEVLQQLGDLLGEDIQPLISAMEQKTKPKQLALIREDECIGCTKCIQACPVDAIMGAAKLMHTVITNECTGCTLCIEPCPMDCIDLIDTDNQSYEHDHARKRYNDRIKRLERLQQEKRHKHVEAKDLNQAQTSTKKNLIKAEILAAVARAKSKK